MDGRKVKRVDYLFYHGFSIASLVFQKLSFPTPAFLSCQGMREEDQLHLFLPALLHFSVCVLEQAILVTIHFVMSQWGTCMSYQKLKPPFLPSQSDAGSGLSLFLSR